MPGDKPQGFDARFLGVFAKACEDPGSSAPLDSAHVRTQGQVAAWQARAAGAAGVAHKKQVLLQFQKEEQLGSMRRTLREAFKLDRDKLSFAALEAIDKKR